MTARSRRHRAPAVVVALAFAASLAAQAAGTDAADLDGLRSSDWRERNRTARALVAAEKVDVKVLLQVVVEPWDGPTPVVARFGGLGVSRSRDVRQRLIQAAREETVGQGHSPYGTRSWTIRGADDLVAAWHPNELARWVLTARGQDHARIATAIGAPPFDDVDITRLWLDCAGPDERRVLAAMRDESGAETLARALVVGTEEHRSWLTRAIADGPETARRAALSVTDPKLLDDRRAVRGAVLEALMAESALARQRAGWCLMQRDGVGAAMLAEQVGGQRLIARRALGLLLLHDELPDTVLTAVAAALPYGARTPRHRALAILGAHDVPAPARSDLAEQMFQLLERPNDPTTQLLAFDVIGRLGAAVTTEMRAALLDSLSDPEMRPFRARALGALWRLESDGDVPVIRRILCVRSAAATEDTWRSLGSGGAEALERFGQLLGDRITDNFEACAHELRKSAPNELRAWLDSDDGVRRVLAIRAFAKNDDPDTIPTATIARLLAESDFAETRDLVRWLASRRDAADHAASAIAATVRVSQDYTLSEGLDFARQHGGDSKQRLIALAPMLRRGLGWTAVIDEDLAGDVRAEALAQATQWLTDTEDAPTRALLLRAAFQLRPESPDAVTALTAALRALDTGGVTTATKDVPRLPAAVLEVLQERLDAELQAMDEDEPPSLEAMYLQERLLEHFGERGRSR